MKKSLTSVLSLVCLVAMAGCDFSNTSSTNKNSSSSSVTTPSTGSNSSTSTSSTSSSSTVDFGSLDTNDLLTLLADTATKGVSGTLSKVELTIDRGYSTQTQTTSFYTNTVHVAGVNEYSYGTVIANSYKTIVDGRYYELEDYDGEITLNGYKVVDSETSSDFEISNADATASVTNLSNASISQGFGLGDSLANIAAGIFNNMTGVIYDLTVDYPAIDAEKVTVSYLSYVLNESMPNYSDLNRYSAEFVFNTSRELVGLNLTQERYDCTIFNAETGEFSEEATPEETHKYNYTLTYGERVAETTPAYDLSSLLAKDFTVTFYQTQEYKGYDPDTYESIYEYSDEITPGSDVANKSSIYPVISYTPTTACDTLRYSYISLDGALWYTDVGDSIENGDSIDFEKPGEIEFSFMSAGGIEKTYSFNVYAPTPEYIEAEEDLPSILPVNSSVYLPACFVEPVAASQDYEYVIYEGSEFATIEYDPDYTISWDQTGAYKLTGVAVGTVVLRAVSKVDSNIFAEYEVNVIDPLSENELKDRLVNNSWGYSEWGDVVNAKFNADGTGYLDFGKEYFYTNDGYGVADKNTTFTFSWELDYENAALDITNGTWNNRQAEGNLSDFVFESATIDLVGRSTTFTFASETYSAGVVEYTFTPALSNDELKSKLADVPFSGYFSEIGLDFYLILNSDGTGSFYTPEWDNETQQDVNTTHATFNWDLDENSNIVFSNISSNPFSFTTEVYDYATWDFIEKTFVVTVSTTASVDKYAASRIDVTVTCDGIEETGVFSSTL